MKNIFFSLLLVSFCSCTQEEVVNRYLQLEGNWKMEGQLQFEEWILQENGDLLGSSYHFVNDKKRVSETLLLTKKKGKEILQATVPDQNDGATISFQLNDSITEYLSFENLSHDFPKKIQYKFLSENELEVSVLGDDDAGFSYKQRKVTAKN